MILSHAHKFIYIKTLKTASTSVEAALVEICEPGDIVTPTTERLMQTRSGRQAQNWRLDHPLVPKRPLWRRLLRRPERHYHPSVGFYDHMPAWRVRAYVGEDIWRSYYKFSFDRNPWDRQVSWYFYKSKDKHDRPGVTFDRFLEDRRRAYVENFDLYSEHDVVMLDFVGKYETLDRDFSEAMRNIGLEEKVSLPVTNISSDKGARDYRRYYTPETRQRMADWYAREIVLLGYEF